MNLDCVREDYPAENVSRLILLKLSFRRVKKRGKESEEKDGPWWTKNTERKIDEGKRKRGLNSERGKTKDGNSRIRKRLEDEQQRRQRRRRMAYEERVGILAREENI